MAVMDCIYLLPKAGSYLASVAGGEAENRFRSALNCAQLFVYPLASPFELIRKSSTLP